MDEAELRRAVEEPARRAGREIDPGTVDLLIEQTLGREGALPLLAFVLSRIWDGFRTGVSSAGTVREIGGVGGAAAGRPRSRDRRGRRGLKYPTAVAAPSEKRLLGALAARGPDETMPPGPLPLLDWLEANLPDGHSLADLPPPPDLDVDGSTAWPEW